MKRLALRGTVIVSAAISGGWFGGMIGHALIEMMIGGKL